MTTKPGLKSKIEYAGLEEKVTEWLFKDKLPYKEILEKLKNEYDIDLTIGSITNFRNYILKSTQEFLRHDEEYREKLAKKYLDTVENLIFTWEEMKRKVDEFQERKDWKQHSTYIGLMLSELHLMLKRAGEMKVTTQLIKQEFNTIQINNIVQVEMVKIMEEEFLKEGQFDIEKIKEFYKRMKGLKNANP